MSSEIVAEVTVPTAGQTGDPQEEMRAMAREIDKPCSAVTTDLLGPLADLPKFRF